MDLRILAVVTGVLGIAVATWYLQREPPPPPPPPTAAAPKAPAPAESSGPRYPIEAKAEGLPPLKESDPAMIEAFSRLWARKR
jgi:hypothetical protein